MTSVSYQSFETFRGVVYPWQCDVMGHMNTQFYARLYDGAAFHFLALLCSSVELKLTGCGWADVRQLIEYKREALAGSLLLVRSTLTRVGNKSIEYRHDLFNAETQELHATSEQITVLFDLAARKATPLSEAIRSRAMSMKV